jgi:hypothetical protein
MTLVNSYVYLQYFRHEITRKVIVIGVQQAAKSSFNVGVRCQLGRKSCSFPQSHLCPLSIVDVCVMIVLRQMIKLN